MNRREFLCATLAGIAAATQSRSAQSRHKSSQPISLHLDNPHYFLWRGKPTILITAGEHYGAALNLDFDYLSYFKELKAHSFNLTRIFSGAYREVPGSFNITGNTLAPAPGKFVCPWARSGDKFDLTKWDETYFKRLKDFIAKAADAGVVVELVFFCTMYDDAVWQASPMNARNNVNGIGKVDKYEVYGSARGDLFDAQRKMVLKLVTELNAFDNLYYEVCNEPYERGGLTKEWNDAIVAAIVDTEAALPNKHLIAQGFDRSPKAIADLNPQVSVLNFHGAKPEVARANLHLNKVLAFDESGGSDRSDRKYRTEAWDWIMSGGAVYDHLDFYFTTDRPDGSAPLPPGTPGGGGPQLRRQLKILKNFIERFDFIHMTPADNLVEKTAGSGTVRVFAEQGRAYAIYINGGSQVRLTLELPAGNYKAEWLSPKTGNVERAHLLRHPGGKEQFLSPAYSEDIALRLQRE